MLPNEKCYNKSIKGNDMSYTLRPFKQSPNYTPNAQTSAFYGRPRIITDGAGHWWDAPERFPSFDGVVATLMNPARQASANAVVGDGVVQELVRDQDTSWATGSANPFTFSIECDPQIIYRWWAGGDKAKANRIFETLCEYIADKRYHGVPWSPHKRWMTTGCNPIDWNDVMRRSKEIYVAKYQAQPPEWQKNLKKYSQTVTKTIARDGAPLRNLANVVQQIKTFAKGTQIELGGETTVNGNLYYLSKYAVDNGTGQGVDEYEFVKPDTRPEWQKNLKDIQPVKLMVLPAQTALYDLNNLSVIKQLGQGTWIDFTKSTTVGGVEYLLSSYSATNGMPNGIKRTEVGVPADPPSEKPEWLKNWQDIEDVKMYTRADTDLVNLEDGSTVKIIPRGTEILVASTTEWHNHKYAITQYSTEKKEGRGIRLDDLDMKPVVTDPDPVEPAPEQPDITVIGENVSWLVKAVKAILAFFGIKV